MLPPRDVDEEEEARQSAYHGVTCKKEHGGNDQWRSSIRVGGKQKHLGFFYDEEEAARAYDAEARKHYTERHCRCRSSVAPSTSRRASAAHCRRATRALLLSRVAALLLVMLPERRRRSEGRSRSRLRRGCHRQCS